MFVRFMCEYFVCIFCALVLQCFAILFLRCLKETHKKCPKKKNTKQKKSKGKDQNVFDRICCGFSLHLFCIFFALFMHFFMFCCVIRTSFSVHHNNIRLLLIRMIVPTNVQCIGGLEDQHSEAVLAKVRGRSRRSNPNPKLAVCLLEPVDLVRCPPLVGAEWIQNLQNDGLRTSVSEYQRPFQ